MRIIHRADWGFNGWSSAPRRKTPSQFTHRTWHYDGAVPCASQTGPGMMRNIHAFHRGPSRGWSGVGYNYVIDSAGNIFEGRGLDFRGAHKPSGPGNNDTGIGIQLHIGGNEKMTPAMIDSAVLLSAWLDQRTGKTLKDTWHNDGYATSCPGPHVIAWVKGGGPRAASPAAVGTPAAPTAKASGRIAGLRPEVTGVMDLATVQAWADYIEAPRPKTGAEWTGDRMFVRRAQTWLSRSRTGEWTRSETRTLQGKVGAHVDGLWGPNTNVGLQRFLQRRFDEQEF